MSMVWQRRSPAPADWSSGTYQLVGLLMRREGVELVISGPGAAAAGLCVVVKDVSQAENVLLMLNLAYAQGFADGCRGALEERAG